MSRESTRQREEVDTDDRERKCPECESTDIVTVNGERVCQECGVVLEEDRLDRGPEWRAYSSRENEEKSRVGAPATHRLHDKGLTTDVNWSEISPSSRAAREQIQRMQKWQKRIRTQGAGERNLRYALGEIDRMASALGVPKSVREVAAVVYRRASDEDLIRGRSIESMSSAALYTACRQEAIPRSLDEVLEVSHIDSEKRLGRAYRYLVQELDLEIKPVDPKEFLPRFCSELDLGEEVQAKARGILDASAEQGLHSGKAPSGLAAAAIYAASLICDTECTQEEIGEVAQVTDVTIRIRYQEQLEAFDASLDTGGNN